MLDPWTERARGLFRLAPDSPVPEWMVDLAVQTQSKDREIAREAAIEVQRYLKPGR